MISDPYKVLGVSRGATMDEIKHAYRNEVKKYHPDANPNDSHAMERMNEINEAYEILTNPEQNQKASYKQQSHANYSSQSTQSYSTSSSQSMQSDSTGGSSWNTYSDSASYSSWGTYSDSAGYNGKSVQKDYDIEKKYHSFLEHAIDSRLHNQESDRSLAIWYAKQVIEAIVNNMEIAKGIPWKPLALEDKIFTLYKVGAITEDSKRQYIFIIKEIRELERKEYYYDMADLKDAIVKEYRIYLENYEEDHTEEINSDSKNKWKKKISKNFWRFVERL